MKKTALIISLVLLSLILFPKDALAFTYVKRTDMGVDESISDQSAKQFVRPIEIAIVNITSPVDEYELFPQDWIKSIYYYSITRLGFLDIPFTYIVDRDGKIYEGRSGGVAVNPETGANTGTVVIGYLSNSTDITSSSAVALKQIISEISYTWAIPKSKVYTGVMTYATNENNLSKSIITKSNSEFAQNLAPVFTSSVYSSSEHISYIAQVKDLTYSSSVKSIEKFTVNLTVVNKNDFPWFSSSNPIYVSTSNLKSSAFADSSTWESFSKPYAITDKTIMPGEEVKISFNMSAMMLPGSYSQKFVIMKLPNLVFAGSLFKISTKVTKGDYSLVKVVDISSLNVRECAGPNCKIVSALGENQVVVMLKYEAGWYQVRYDGKKTGWVYGKYISEL
ncbi:SH3 domain-containing protein [Candidatus Dojkabacteria bacterium]|jgi:hypothetical protein|nr:SH3 domain-containing protein [Candidatus Dojkabacteria bacterium]